MNRGILNTEVIDKMKERIRERIRSDGPSLPEITCAASMAHHVHGPPTFEWSWSVTLADDFDLSSVPPDHLESLISYCVGRTLKISNNVRGSGLVSILSNVAGCRGLFIDNQTLDVEETEALVKGMESDGWGLTLILREGVTLDIKTLTTYSGQGQCHGVYCSGDTAARYREELQTWAKCKNWNWKAKTGCYDFTFTR